MLLFFCKKIGGKKDMAAVNAGVSTLGVKLGYALESTKGTKPTDFKWLERANNIAGIDLSTEQIDASALEDLVSRYVAGRQDSGGSWAVTFNATDEVFDQIKAMVDEYNARGTGLRMWFEVWSPYLTDAFYVVAIPPQAIPVPETAQNGLMTIELTFTLEEYKGLDTAIEPKNS